MKYKGGRFSKYETQFIQDNAKHLDYMEIAKALNREPTSVRKYIEEKLGYEVSLQISGSPIKPESKTFSNNKLWHLLGAQLSKEEYELAEYHWNHIVNEQFQGDVLHTEELQVIDLIRFEIDLYRNSTAHKTLSDRMKELSDDMKGADDKRKRSLNEEYRQCQISLMTLQGEALNIQKEKKNILKEIKGTRNQRISHLESARESFPQWLSELINNPKIREELGKDMERRRLAMYKERDRLSTYHDFGDGHNKVDQPFLNHETIQD